jgi:hypothetical protein
MLLTDVQQEWANCWGPFGSSVPAASSIGVSAQVRTYQEELLQVIKGVVDNAGRPPGLLFDELGPQAFFVGFGGKDSSRMPLIESAHFGQFGKGKRFWLIINLLIIFFSFFQNKKCCL